MLALDYRAHPSGLAAPDNRWRYGRLLAGLLAGAGLWLLAFPPTHHVPRATNEALVLTDGYSPDTLRRLLRQLGPGTALWRYPATASPDTPALTNLAVLRHQVPALRQVHVLGQGLPAADLPDLGTIQLITHGAKPGAGFRHATWARRPEVGQPWVAEGWFDNIGLPAGPVWVRLRAAGALRDSVQLPTGKGSFRVSFRPKTPGQAVYELDARPSAQASQLQTEPLPVEILPSRPLRVLLLAATPSFEFRFLKNYLAKQRHAVSLRTGLSRGLTQTEFLNQKAADLTRLNASLLSHTDVVVADAASVSALSGAEAGALRAALQEGQAGVLLLADSPTLPRALPARSAFALEMRFGAAAQQPQVVRWAGATDRATALVPALLRSTSAAKSLVTTTQNQAVAAARRVGQGQVVVTTLTETFPWMLQGNATTYGAYWSQLLSAAAPTLSPTGTITAEQAWPRPNAPLTLRLSGTTQALVVTPPGGQPVRVAPHQDVHIPDWATATYWPTTSGWHRFSSGAATSWVYVYSPTQWMTPHLQTQQAAAAAWAAQPTQVSNAVLPASTTSVPWSRWWGFVLFLLGAGFLWLEEKL
ncbi:hypothetical protein [Hymenobacter sp. AT01-02]|uniref:hypothetical protein n=1 Tax=Hymenobacter sp. AT01-02 TaxID=1571877 RepID=UPI0006E2EAA0|nr:hypothetical protein [Hymenobacter sp. AT01-02]